MKITEKEIYKMEKKKALLVISFGTSIDKARAVIQNIETHLADRYPKHDFFRAFTSRMIVKKLKQRDGIHVDFPNEALKKLYEKGYSDVVCQSLHIINGIEYELTQKLVTEYKQCFDRITLGKPLLTDISDYERITEMFIPAAKSRSAILFMGHGTSHHSNSAYSMLEDMFRYKGADNVYIATVEGFPDIHYAVKKMKKDGVEKVTLMPFMIVAGDHANSDMAGDDKDSWKSILLDEGFEVEMELKGLGEYTKIAEMFYDHIKQSREQGEI